MKASPQNSVVILGPKIAGSINFSALLLKKAKNQKRKHILLNLLVLLLPTRANILLSSL
jgi:hypothetical protein